MLRGPGNLPRANEDGLEEAAVAAAHPRVARGILGQ
jgi:hypothetical protein